MSLNYVPLAKVAYSAYINVLDSGILNGANMPDFDHLPPKIQDAWVAAVKAARVGPVPTWQEKDQEC